LKGKETKKLFKDCFATFYRPAQLLEFVNKESAIVRGLRYSKSDVKKGIVEVGERDQNNSYYF